MLPPPNPPDEAARIAALHALRLLDTPPDERFDRITRTAQRLFGVPIVLVSLVDSERQWFKSCIGLATDQTDREVSFCAHAILQDDVFVVQDTHVDERFADNRLVTEDPFIRFYAGWPLREPSGHRVGTLCLIDRRPRAFGPDDRSALRDLGAWVEHELATHELGRATEALRASEEYLNAVLMSVADGVATFDIRGEVLSFNRSAEAMFRRPAADVVGDLVTSLVDEPDRGRVLQLLAERASKPVGEEVWIEATGLRSDGTKFLMDVAVGEVQGSQGQVFIAIARDITELSRLRRRNELILNSAGQGIIGVDASGRVDFVNPAAARAFDLLPEALVGAHLHRTTHHSHPDGTPYHWEECPTHQTLTEGVSVQQAAEHYLRADGSFFPVEFSSQPVLEDGVVTGAVITFSDVTQRRELERLKDQFVSVVSHELRTPLTSLRGSLGLLASGALEVGSDQASRMLEIAVANTDRLRRLVDDILDLERMRAGRAPLEVRQVDVAHLLHLVVESSADAAGAAGVALFLEPGPSMTIDGDADRLVQVLTNLIGNAVKFSPPGGTVWVSDQRVGNEVQLRVRDEGRGIPAGQLEQIFQPFEQVERADAIEKGGSGLGLAISRGILEQHGGRIWAESVEGEGSTFVVVLPMGKGSR